MAENVGFFSSFEQGPTALPIAIYVKCTEWYEVKAETGFFLAQTVD